jgi:hypothetical protein
MVGDSVQCDRSCRAEIKRKEPSAASFIKLITRQYKEGFDHSWSQAIGAASRGKAQPVRETRSQPSAIGNNKLIAEPLNARVAKVHEMRSKKDRGANSGPPGA